jgi:hypothetical protein
MKLEKHLLKFTFLFLTSVCCLNSNAQVPNWQWAKSVGSTGYDVGLNIATDTLGNVYTTGYYEGTVDFDPGPAIFNLTAVGGQRYLSFEIRLHRWFYLGKINGRSF